MREIYKQNVISFILYIRDNPTSSITLDIPSLPAD